MIENRRKMNLADWLDKLLIGAVGVVIAIAGYQVQYLGNRVSNLCENMAAVLVELKSEKEQVDRLQARMDQHEKEDRERYRSFRP